MGVHIGPESVFTFDQNDRSRWGRICKQRIALVKALADTGVPEVEIGSFVSPKAVPQMAGTDRIAQSLPQATAAQFSALVPNRKGFDLALAAGIKTHAIAISATESMNQNNIRMNLPDTFAMADELIREGNARGVDIHVYLAVAFECPFEGRVPLSTVLQQAESLMAQQPARLVIADTIGAADPASVKTMMTELVSAYGAQKLGCHFHDTRALAVANVYAALDAGIRQFDSSAGGLGGCPFAPGAKGNVATEDIALLCQQQGLHTGLDIQKLLSAVALLSEFMESPQGGRSHYWLKNNWQKLWPNTAVAEGVTA